MTVIKTTCAHFRAMLATTLAIVSATNATAQCTFLVQDTFNMNPRPHGGSGQLRQPDLGDNISSYWPLVPENVQWIGPNSGAIPNWFFAAASLDPFEVDPNDPYNGIAFVGASHATLLLPFTPTPTKFTLSFETALGQGVPNPVFLGYTARPANSDNFQTHGALWLSIDSVGNWQVFANGSNALVAGGTYWYGPLYTGWVHAELTFDPASSTVSGIVGQTRFGPEPVALQLPLSYVGMEAHDNFFNGVNNFVVRTGVSPTVTAAGPGSITSGATATLTAASDAAAPEQIWWFKDGSELTDGPLGAATVAGANSLNLTITNSDASAAGQYTCLIANACGSYYSNPITLTVAPPPCSGDLNGDRLVDLGDLSVLLSNYGLTSGATPTQGDMTGDGNVDLGDLSALLSHYGANCS